MINKRILVKNLISHNSECTFFDLKEKLDLKSEAGKAKLLKHITALSNSNPKSEAFLIFGVKDKNSSIEGIEFVDDSDMQNLVKSYLENPPIIKFDNIFFPELPPKKSVGLLTIISQKEATRFKKKIWKFKSDASFYRYGSNSIPWDEHFYVDQRNPQIIKNLKKNSRNNLETILDGVFGFQSFWGPDYLLSYKVFKETFAVVWGGCKDSEDADSINEVNIYILNESKRFFYSCLQDIEIQYTDEQFKVIEYIGFLFEDEMIGAPFEELKIEFRNNGTYNITKHCVLTPPTFDKEKVSNLYSKAKEVESKFKNNKLTEHDFNFGEALANHFLICYFNGIEEAKNDLINSIDYLDGSAAEWQSECLRVL